jgi:undecaprenyl-diphosphatase
MNEMLIKLIADGAVIPVVMLGAWVLLVRLPKNSDRLQVYARILMAGLTAYLFAKLIGSIYQPEMMRPFEKLGLDAGASFMNNPGFPSDHVLFCMAISLAVWFETKQRKLAWILFVLTALVAIGRVLALVHTPLDVIGGVLIACAGIPWYLQRPKHKQQEPDARKKRKSTV